MITQFGDILLDWYQTHARSLPWRDQIDPYLVWVSEIMLQQTRVETVIPYFKRWMGVFPNIDSLASASQQEVLAEWEGLGYYSRARNLHRAAQIVRAEYGGHLPREVNRLCQLPGIGRSTAGAIASIAFGMDEPVLDGNIRRVLARLFDVREPSRSAAGEKQLWELAEAHLPPRKAGDYNQALMDLGALVCTPQHPRCEACPLNTTCVAYASGVQEERPIRLSKPTLPHHIVSSAIIQKNHQVLIAQRPPDGLLGGMWEFPGGKVEAGEDLITGLKREICEELGVEILVGSPFGVYHHAYTHFRVTLHAFFCELNGSQPRSIFHSQFAWCEIATLHDYPMGKIDRQISNALLTLEKAG
jgi:A/G-specific adenine glycosylase